LKGGISVSFPNLQSSQTPRPVTTAFIRSISGTAGTITLFFWALFLWEHASPVTLTIVGGCACAYFVLWRLASRPFTPFLLIAVCWLIIGILDEGFRSSSAVWLFLIPITLAGWIILPHPILRWVVLIVPMALVALSNFCGGPVQHVPLPKIDPQLHTGLHFMAAFFASVYCVQHLLTMEAAIRTDLENARLRAEKASRTKDDFLSHMSHEFRTPLNAINGFSEILLAQAKTDSVIPSPSGMARGDSLENLDAIRSAAGHLIHIVEDILDLARLESGEMRLLERPFCPNLVMTDVRSSLLGKAGEKNISLVLAMDEELPGILGDKVRWKQILLNLAGNAIKFSNSREIQLSLRWIARDAETGVLEARISDQGPGVPSDLVERIFERFVRAESVERAGTTGTGLGLAISRNLARAMGGDLVLEKTSKDGSTFLARIPFPLAHRDDLGSDAFPRVAPQSLKGFHVLLCEDNRLNIRLATKLLERLEATFDVAEDGGKALEILRSRPYDLVLLDLHMPVADGFEVASFLRGPNRPDANRHVPILALTADAFLETREKARLAGMDDFLAKPYSFEDLAIKAGRLLGVALPVDDAVNDLMP